MAVLFPHSLWSRIRPVTGRTFVLPSYHRRRQAFMRPRPAGRIQGTLPWLGRLTAGGPDPRHIYALDGPASGRHAGSKAHFCLGWPGFRPAGRIQGTFLPWLARLPAVTPDPRHIYALVGTASGRHAGSKAHFCLGWAGSRPAVRIQGTFLPWMGRLPAGGPDPRHISALVGPASGRHAGSKAHFCLGWAGSRPSRRIQGTFLPWLGRFTAVTPDPRHISALDGPASGRHAESKAHFCLGWHGFRPSRRIQGTFLPWLARFTAGGTPAAAGLPSAAAKLCPPQIGLRPAAASLFPAASLF
ncbi:hypothetical protein B8V81_0720 [Paenibacillus pasadenensis]|uniref:Uncharacterized protein n=1 Tax=Paenibacillus pasadenensis TaxID=217090 RepID=A0A2N5NBW0_9BACL|nr:hypothetical protein B8V81_0720 [Paenibacillus pasadenensis]